MAVTWEKFFMKQTQSTQDFGQWGLAPLSGEKNPIDSGAKIWIFILPRLTVKLWNGDQTVFPLFLHGWK